MPISKVCAKDHKTMLAISLAKRHFSLTAREREKWRENVLQTKTDATTNAAGNESATATML